MLNNPYMPKREFFDKGNTRSREFRLEQLDNLKISIKKYENDLIHSLMLDLNKSEFESYTAEIGILYQEIDLATKNLKKWMQAKKVSTPIYLQPASSFIYPEPKGVVLIISPWNYPFQLAISPLIGAIAAGNCILLKPSHKSKNVANIIETIIDETFPSQYISTIQGPGSQVISPLIKQYRFDHIFFTGSVNIGKRILKLAANHLTPVTLELGGKSPTIVHKDADIDLAAKRISWAKFYNCGQTCVAPDYLLVHQSQKDNLIQKIQHYISIYYGENPIESHNLARIINERQFNRLVSLLEGCHIIHGGDSKLDERYISPTLVGNVDMDHPIMEEEIFGPILPILTYNDIPDLMAMIQKNPYPLALYLFTKDRDLEEYIIGNIQFGGGCINHLISHVANSHLPFGGIGFSGMGNYHSKYSFDTFSHQKSILKSRSKLDTNILYPPYTDKKLNLAKKFL